MPVLAKEKYTVAVIHVRHKMYSISVTFLFQNTKYTSFGSVFFSLSPPPPRFPVSLWLLNMFTLRQRKIKQNLYQVYLKANNLFTVECITRAKFPSRVKSVPVPIFRLSESFLTPKWMLACEILSRDISSYFHVIFFSFYFFVHSLAFRSLLISHSMNP